MAYQTGTATTPANLLTIIETFALSNGYTLNAGSGSWLSQNQTHVQLVAPNTTRLDAYVSTSATGPAETSSFTGIYIAPASWPVTYYLFYSSTPDLLVCVLHYDTNYIQMLMFGELAKIHSSAYVGGNFCHGTGHMNGYSSANQYLSLTDTELTQPRINNVSYGERIPFSDAISSVYSNHALMHVEIDGKVWKSGQDLCVKYAETTKSMLYRSPNTWNSQALLVPIHLHFDAAASYKMHLGYIEHLRFIRITNYEIGDIITLGADKWKVFPWYLKNTVSPNGESLALHTGTVGFAVRYDGP